MWEGLVSKLIHKDSKPTQRALWKMELVSQEPSLCLLTGGCEFSLIPVPFFHLFFFLFSFFLALTHLISSPMTTFSKFVSGPSAHVVTTVFSYPSLYEMLENPIDSSLPMGRSDAPHINMAVSVQ